MKLTKGQKKQGGILDLLLAHGWSISPRSREVLVHPDKTYRIRLTSTALHKEQRLVDRWSNMSSRVHYLKDIVEGERGLVWNERVLVAW